MEHDNAWKQAQINAEIKNGWAAVDMIFYAGEWWFVLDTGVIYQRDADGIRLYMADKGADETHGEMTLTFTGDMPQGTGQAFNTIEQTMTVIYDKGSDKLMAVNPELWYSLHTADPGESGAHELVAPGYERITEDQAADGFHFDGDMTVTHVGRWTAKQGGVFIDAQPIIDEGADDATTH